MVQKGVYTKHMFNPYQPYIQNQQIIRVNGLQGAENFAIAPGSSVLMLDESDARLFVKSTNQAGYSKIDAFKLEPYTPLKEPTNAELLERIENIERMITNEKSNTAANKRKSAETAE